MTSKSLTFVLLLISNDQAMACMYESITVDQARRIADLGKTARDCAFTDFDAFSNDNVDYDTRYVEGLPVKDIGSGKVAQRFSEELCTMTEHLLFVDCKSGEAVLIRGAEKAEDVHVPGYYREYLIKFIQKPYGPIEVTSNLTVKGLLSVAAQNGLTVVDNIGRYLETGYDLQSNGKVEYLEVPPYSVSNQNYDINCGCALYYPSWPGIAD